MLLELCPISAIMPSRRARSIKALAYRRAAAPPLKALLPYHGLPVNSASIHAHSCTSIRLVACHRRSAKEGRNILNFSNWGNDASIFC